MQLEDFLSSNMSKPRLRTEREVNDKLENLRNRAGTQTLDEEYERVYDQNTLPGSESQEHAVRAYKLLLCCVEPLSLNVLAAAVAVRKGGEHHSEVTDTYILEICSNFIVIVDGYVRFAHPSAKEYLEHRKIGEIQEYSVEQQHLQAASTCLFRVQGSYIGVLELCAAIPSWGRQTPVDMSRHLADCDKLRVNLKSLPQVWCPEPFGKLTKIRSQSAYFTVYACRYWLYHTDKVSFSAREKEGITQEIADFMYSPLYQHWVVIESFFSYGPPNPEGFVENWRSYKNKVGDCFRFLGWSPGKLQADEKPEPGLMIATFGFVDLLRLSGIAEDFLLCAVDSEGNTPLHLASKHGQSQFCDEYLKRYAGNLDVNAQTENGETPLHTAMLFDEVENIETISILLNNGIDIGKTDSFGWAAFHHLCRKSISLAQLLIEHLKTRPELDQTLLVAEDERGDTALHMALYAKREDLFAVLFGEIADRILDRQLVTHAGDLLGVSLLMEASRLGSAQSLQIVLKSGIPVNATISSSDATALHVAATIEVAEYILQLELPDQSLLSKRDAFGMTPLLSACSSKKWELCQFFLDHGADAKALAPNGQSALHIYVQNWRNSSHEPNMALLEILIQKLAGLSDLKGNTALHLVGRLRCRLRFSRWWGILVLKLMEAGEDLSTLNHADKMAVQSLFPRLALWDDQNCHYKPLVGSGPLKVGYGGQLVGWKIIIHLMKELRQAETVTRLKDKHLDLSLFCCHRLIESFDYSYDKAEALMRGTATQSDQLALGYLQTQKASGWQLPPCRVRYRIDLNDDEKSWRCVKSSDKSSITDDEDEEEREQKE
jgi:ankyrin repeat protein